MLEQKDKFEAKDDRKVKGYEFYRGTGFHHLTGTDEENLKKYQETLEEMKESVCLRGNLFEPVLTAQFPGCPTPMPINLYGLPDRKLEHCMVVVKPGYGFPLHHHAYGDEVYLVIQGKGKIVQNGETFDAKQHDIFHMASGIEHTLFNPAENDEDFCVFIVNAPAIPLEARAMEFAIPKEK